ncbi:helix-turn-helix transcriptional regulator [Streptomyces sp. VRA16 Mangrove soil]|uniref:helix-turn-helix domain-containing protein n=1 Tax=Streptomyces sp. VRA16 Mangrove soil TaxID=2817434 RepID=UPI001A9E288B|nr:helix-turn-helix transcriptional regulator [Streptomyces sp. VRA16 Mangrove soil]MBO1335870.1 helix-turn-helix domain-containing protein [Streptomyces sp. VRA16 Mangrove soil]
MPQSEMPTIRSRRLGAELRRLRTDAGLKVNDAALALECGQPKISQIETGKRGIRQLDLTTLLNLYGVTDDQQRTNLKRLARDIHKVDWWSGQGPLLSGDLRDYLTLEADSSLVRAFEPSVLPGLLQTEAYMREIFMTGAEADRVEPLVNTRMRRKDLLSGTAEFRLRVVIDAPALHRIPGPRALIRQQFEHLMETGELPNVTIQVLPLDITLPLAQYAPYTLFTLRGEPTAQVAWLEHMTGGTILEQRPDVEIYAQAWDELTAAALSPAQSRRYISERIKQESGS